MNKIGLTLVRSPEYIERQKCTANQDIVLSLYESFPYKYELLFLDYSKDSVSSDKNYINNELHLNANGAELFTRQLSHDL